MKSLQEFQAELRAEGVRGRRILPPALSYKVNKTVNQHESSSSISNAASASALRNTAQSNPSVAVEVPEIPPPLPPPVVTFSSLEKDVFESLDSTHKNSEMGERSPSSGAKICELCSTDKAKIAKIIQRVVKLSEEKTALGSAKDALEKKHNETLQASKREVEDLQSQVKALKRKFADSLKMVKSYQDRLKQLEMNMNGKKTKNAEEEEAQFDKLKKEVERLHNLVIQHTGSSPTRAVKSSRETQKENRSAPSPEESHSFLSALALEISEATQDVVRLRKSLANQPDDVRTNLRLRSKQQALQELENLLFEAKFGTSRREDQHREMGMEANLENLLESRNASFMKETETTSARFGSWPATNLATRTGGRGFNGNASRDRAGVGARAEMDYSKLSARLQNKDLELTTDGNKETETKEYNEEHNTASSSEDEILESFLNNQRKARFKHKPGKPTKKKATALRGNPKLKSPHKKKKNKVKVKMKDKSSPKRGNAQEMIDSASMSASDEESIPDAQDLDTSHFDMSLFDIVDELERDETTT